MNIAIDIRALSTKPRTGVGEFAFELLSALFLAHPEHTYYLLSSGRKPFVVPPAWHKPNIILLHLPWPNRLLHFLMFLFNWPRLNDWPRLLKKSVPAFDYLYLPNLNFAPADSSVRTIVTVHDLSFIFFPKFFSIKQRFWHRLLRPAKLLNAAHGIIVPSQNTRRDVHHYYTIPENKISVLYPGLCSEFSSPTQDDVGRVKKKYNLPDNFILFLGTLEPRKNVTALILAFQELQKNNSADNVKLVLAGASGWKNYPVKKLIAKNKNIISIGYVAEKDKPALYQLARVFCYPSFYEGFGFPVLEAMVAGTPVITSNRSSLIEVVENAAYQVNPYRIDEIVRGLELLLSNQEARAMYIQRGLEQSKKFSWQNKNHPASSLISNVLGTNDDVGGF